MTDAVAALQDGKPVVMPFDTVYGLAADPYQGGVDAASLQAEGPRRSRAERARRP